jgi:hypothetical protein
MWASAYFHFTCGWVQVGDAFARHELYRYPGVSPGTQAAVSLGGRLEGAAVGLAMPP